MSDIYNQLRSDFAHLTRNESLRAKPGVLLGVTDAAQTQLDSMGLRSIFDLGSSRIFTNATLLVEAATNPGSVLARYGLAPSDMLDMLPPGLALADIPNESVRLLEGIGPANAAAVEKALEVSTIRDLAFWPPYVTASHMVKAVLAPETLAEHDPEAPPDLLPTSGDYPTEQVFYSTLVFDGAEPEPESRPLEQSGQVPLDPIVQDGFGFHQPGMGAQLTFSQSWYSQGVALGQLLHSVALAPGESTRIAMIDWSRRTRGAQSETADETESLTNTTQHSRALSEVAAAVAQESQSGFSSTETISSSEQRGGATGISLGPLTWGHSSGSATGGSSATSFSSSAGRRDLFAAMAQNVVDTTQQSASSARSRRASVVREVSQSEHETISTRVVTNYNHMHALSVQYYEVVQIYRVSVALARAEKCLFIPMQLVDFQNTALVRRFRSVLEASAISADAKTLLTTDFETVTIKNLTNDEIPSLSWNAVPYDAPKEGGLRIPDECRLHGVTVFRHGKPPFAPVTVRYRDGASESLASDSNPDSKDEYALPPIPLRDMHEIEITSTAPPEATSYLVNLNLTYKGVPFYVGVSIKIPPGPPTAVLSFSGGGVWQRVVDHLTENRLHYSQAIYRSLDPATTTLLLSNYTYGGKPLAAQIDPQPLAIAGNYLVFRTHVTPDFEGTEEEAEWARWLEEHGIASAPVKEDLVPLPSGGVFAEAVTGRYNSAEKLDMTRFWNWQDSPIPIEPPEIAALQSGSRATDEDLKGAPFSQPLVNIVSPTNLPDPTGLAATLQAISNGAMFRDMSGLANTIGLAQSGLNATTDAAIAGSTQAGSNMAIAAKKDVEKFKAALSFLSSMFGKGGSDTSPSTISNEGAKINHGRNLDARGIQGANASGAGSSGISGVASGRTPSGGGGSTINPGSPAQAGQPPSGNPNSNEGSAFNRSLWGPVGQSQSAAVKDLAGYGLETVADHYTPQARTPNQLIGLVGEQLLAKSLEEAKLIVFRDWTKHVAGNGFDLIAYDPKTEKVWLIDNKAQLRGISNAGSLTGPQFEANKKAAQDFLEKVSPHPDAAKAALALKEGRIEKVVGNAWAGQGTRFTKSLFDRKLAVFDIRLKRFFNKYNDWEPLYRGLERGIHRPGLRGAVVLEGTFFVFAVVEGVLWAVRSGESVVKELGEVALSTGFGAVLSRLPGGWAAGLVIGMESDESPSQRAARKREETIEQVTWSIEGFDSLSPAEKKSIKDEIGRMLDDPLVIETPPTPSRDEILPGLPRKDYFPNTDWT